MSTRQALRTVQADEKQPEPAEPTLTQEFDAMMVHAREKRLAEEGAAAEDFASGTEFGPSDMALTDEDFKDFVPLDPKGLVTRWRDHLQSALDSLTVEKAAAEKRIALAAERVGERQAAALRVFEEEKAAALAEHVAALADAEADLEQLGACKDAIDLAVARLNKAS